MRPFISGPYVSRLGIQTTNLSLMSIIEMRILDDFGASSILRQSHSKGGDGRSLKSQDIHLKPSWMIMAGTADPLEDDFRLETLGTQIYEIVLVLSWLVHQKHGSDFYALATVFNNQMPTIIPILLNL